MKKVKEERGRTLISLTITILVMTVLTVTLTASLNSTTELKRFNEVKSDVLALSQEVKAYYLKNGTLPVDKTVGYDVTTSGSRFFIPDKDRNPNDSGSYYAIDWTLLDIKLTKGNKNTEKDVYVVNEKSFTVYYLDGIELGSDRYYTMEDSFKSGSHTEEYYSKVSLPIISVVTMESSNENKEIAKKRRYYSNKDIIKL